MQKPKIYIHRLGHWYSLFMNGQNEAALRDFADVVSEGDREAPLSADELKNRMRGCSAILSLNGFGAGEITNEVLNAVETIELICISQWWGHFPDVARTTNIAVTEGSNANTIAVAEWTLASALMGIRRFQHFDRALKSGSPWVEPRRDVGLLCESTVGILGLGRIGWYVAQYFRNLGARVIAYDKYCEPRVADAIGVRLCALDEILKTADVISLHLPVAPETTGLLGQREFSLIRNGAVFINSARAALYDEPALITELEKGRFSAFLDVFSVEPMPLDHPFRGMANVTITPHIAGDNRTMFQRCAREAIETLREYFERGKLRNLKYSFP